MTARMIVHALGGHWHGSYGMARCPVPSHGSGNGDRNPSLKVMDGDGGAIVHCHGGCDWQDVKAELRRRGLLPEFEPTTTTRSTAALMSSTSTATASADTIRRTQAAQAIWERAEPIAGTLAHEYLRSRDITIPPPPSLRYASLTHGPTGLVFPAMIAGVQVVDHHPVAVHRTYLQLNGRGKANVSQPRMALGPIAGGAVRLGPAGVEIGICEGIETGLSVAQLFGVTVWCCLGGSNMKNLALPEIVERVRIFGDNGEPGHRFAESAAEAFHRQGRKVTLTYPTEQYGDFNDVLGAEEHAA